MKMLELILGLPGSGKTACLKEMIKKDIDEKKTVFLIVPEQAALDVEAEFTAFLPPSAQLHFEVVNFTRLANRVLRTYGGISHKYLTSGMRACLMWRTLSEIGELSSMRSSPSDSSFISLMLSASDELRLNGITPEMLTEAAEEAEPPLAAKLRDLALVNAVYSGLAQSVGTVPGDDVTKLAAVLSENSFFEGTRVYIDSFTDFTSPQLSVVSSIIRQADGCVIALTCDEGGLEENIPSSPQYKKSYKTASLVRALGRRASSAYTERFLPGSRRASSEELRFLNENLWTNSGAVCEKEPRSIRLLESSDKYFESERIAADICRLVSEEGLRYNEIAVIARDVKSYEGIIDAMFDKFSIPFFMSKRSDIMSKAPIKMLFCALSVLRFGWRREDVLTYIKTSLAGLDPDECDELSIYSEKWNISGSGFYGDIGWSMNPAGLREEMSEHDALLLSRLNDSKDKVRLPLLSLSEALSNRPTVREACRGIFEFLTEVDMRGALERRIEADRAEGRLTEAAENAQLWNILLDALDRLSAVCSERQVDISEITALLSLMLGETSVGAIPQSADAVTVGSASALRARGIKVAYLIGCERGVFPAAVVGNSIFSDDEKLSLEGCGIIMRGSREEYVSDELFYFQRAAALPTDRLIFSYTLSPSGDSSPSIGIENAVKLFPALTAERLPQSSLDLLYSREEMRDALPSLPDFSPLSAAIKEVLRDDRIVKTLERDYPLVLEECSLSESTAKELFPDRMSLTQSRLETFISCKFSYYCNYILGLDPSRKAFDRADVGTLMHGILERALNSDQSVDRVVEEYITRICPREKLSSARIAGLFTRLKTTAALLVKELREEFSQSDFRPRFFEYRFGMSEGSSALSFPLPDGASISLSGIADRIDSYTKDGKAYIRIVDYKTGKKDFSLKDVADGINLQLLIYLFSLWKSPSRDFLAELGADTVVPAGILYFEARPPKVTLTSGEDVEALEEKEQSAIKRSGLFLDDPEILRAMDKELDGRFIPVKLKKDGVSFASETNIASLEKFGQLFSNITDTVTKIGEEIRSGAADAKPKTVFTNGKNRPRCAYCDMYPICRRNRNV